MKPADTGRLERSAVGVLLAYYAGRLAWLASCIAPGLPPDESTHAGIIELYSRVPLFIQDNADSYVHGLVTQVPWLYYFSLGKLLALNGLGIDDLVFLRLANGALSVATVLVGYALALRLTESVATRLLFLVMITNTPMSTFLGAAVSYDNLVNLLAALALLALVSFLQDRSSRPLLLLGLWCLLGGLAKTSFLPIAALLAVVLVAERRKGLASDLSLLLADLKSGGRLLRPLALLVLLAAIGNAHLYLGNLARHSKLVPSCNDVLDVENCMENRIFARNRTVMAYRDDSVSHREAVLAATQIPFRGDRDHALRLIEHERKRKATNPAALPVHAYAHLIWTGGMKPSIFGIQAHVSALRSPRSLTPYDLILLAGLVLWVRSLSWSRRERPWLWLSFVVAGYAAILIGLVNYRVYLVSGAPFLSVQGRYLFPVLAAACLLLARNLVTPWRPRVGIAIALLVGAVFTWGDLPWFLQHVTPEWFQG